MEQNAIKPSARYNQNISETDDQSKHQIFDVFVVLLFLLLRSESVNQNTWIRIREWNFTHRFAGRGSEKCCQKKSKSKEDTESPSPCRSRCRDAFRSDCRTPRCWRHAAPWQFIRFNTKIMICNTEFIIFSIHNRTCQCPSTHAAFSPDQNSSYSIQSPSFLTQSPSF